MYGDYPQLTQFPIVKRMRRRTVINRAADGRIVKIGGPGGGGHRVAASLHGAERRGGRDAAGVLLAVEGTLQRVHVSGPDGESAGVERQARRSGLAKAPLLTVSGGVD